MRRAPAKRARPAPGPGATPVGAAALLERLDAGRFPVTLYIEGPSEPLKAAWLAELRAAWHRAVPDSPAHVFRAAESQADEILAAFQSNSLFATRDLVIVLDVEDIGRSEKKVLALAAGLGTPAGDSCLVLVESAADSPRKSLEPLRAACREIWTAAPPDRRALAGWGIRRLRAGGVAAGPDVLEAVLAASEGDPLVFFNELDKLIVLAAREGRLTRERAEQLLQPIVGAELPDYLAAVAAGHRALAARRLGRVLAAGVGEGTVLFALSNLVGGALGGWARNPGLSAELRRRRPRDLAHAVDAVYRAEAAWKSGRADAIAALEQATRAVAGERRR